MKGGQVKVHITLAGYASNLCKGGINIQSCG